MASIRTSCCSRADQRSRLLGGLAGPRLSNTHPRPHGCGRHALPKRRPERPCGRARLPEAGIRQARGGNTKPRPRETWSAGGPARRRRHGHRLGGIVRKINRQDRPPVAHFDQTLNLVNAHHLDFAFALSFLEHVGLFLLLVLAGGGRASGGLGRSPEQGALGPEDGRDPGKKELGRGRFDRIRVRRRRGRLQGEHVPIHNPLIRIFRRSGDVRGEGSRAKENGAQDACLHFPRMRHRIIIAALELNTKTK